MELNKNYNDISNQYDRYYEGAGNSLYNKRFGDKRVTPNEEEIITNIFKKLTKKLAKTRPESKEIKILDFGCGDGRIFPVIEKLANQYKKDGWLIQLSGYDPCSTGLTSFKNMLLEKGYDENHCSLSKNNLTINLILGDVNEELEVIARQIGNGFDLCLCIYGVLNHIPYRENRINHLKMINSLLAESGELLLSICSKNVFPSEMKAYSLIRRQFADCLHGSLPTSADIRQQILRLATEPGDLYYCVDPNHSNKAADIFAHIDTPEELKANLKAANFNETLKIKIMSILNPYEIANHCLKGQIDKMLSKIATILCFTDNLKNQFGMHLYVHCQKAKIK